MVITSHLHNDHAGTNCLYPAARVLVRGRAWDYAVTLMDTPSTGHTRSDCHAP